MLFDVRVGRCGRYVGCVDCRLHNRDSRTRCLTAPLREDGTELRIKAGQVSKEQEMRFVKDFSVVSDTKATRDRIH